MKASAVREVLVIDMMAHVTKDALAAIKEGFV